MQHFCLLVQTFLFCQLVLALITDRFVTPGLHSPITWSVCPKKRTHHAVRNTLTLFSACNMLVICLYLPCMPFQLIKGITIPPNTKALYKPLKATFDRCIFYLCFVSFRKCKLEFTNWHFVFVLCIPFLPHYYGKTLSQIACIVSCGVFVLNRYKLYLATKKTNTRHLRLFCARNISSDNGEDTSRS